MHGPETGIIPLRDEIALEFADMEAENGLVVDCKDFDRELAGMGCVLAIGFDSCTHEPEFSEVELADMGCVLARLRQLHL